MTRGKGEYGPAECPVCGSVGVRAWMLDHIEAEHGTGLVTAEQHRGAVSRLEGIERELRAAAVKWRNAEELDGRTIRDDFNRIADLAAERTEGTE